jgi:hypothetical protein
MVMTVLWADLWFVVECQALFFSDDDVGILHTVKRNILDTRTRKPCRRGAKLPRNTVA